jgi:hypothetical protein
VSRVESLRAVARFNIQRRYAHNADGTVDWSVPVAFTVRPKGFDTELFKITKPETTSIHDFVAFMDAVANLAGMAPPKIRKRKAKK